MRRAASCSARGASGLRRVRPGPARARHTPRQRSGHAPDRVWPRCGRPARRCGAPAATPAVRSWRPCSSFAASLPWITRQTGAAPARLAGSKPPSMNTAPMSASTAVGQDGRPLRATAAAFAFGQPHHGSGRPSVQRHAVQAVFAHQVGAHARQVTFVAAQRNVRTAGPTPPGSAPRRPGIQAARCDRHPNCGGSAHAAAGQAGKR
jgi:hypothetical protein